VSVLKYSYFARYSGRLTIDIFPITLQSIGDTQGSTMLIKSLFFYVVITLEAFIFCYAGEYLSAKVRMMELQILSLRIQPFLRSFSLL